MTLSNLDDKTLTSEEVFGVLGSLQCSIKATYTLVIFLRGLGVACEVARHAYHLTVVHIVPSSFHLANLFLPIPFPRAWSLPTPPR